MHQTIARLVLAITLCLSSWANAAELKELSRDPNLLNKLQTHSLGFQAASDEEFLKTVGQGLAFDSESSLELEKTTSLPSGNRVLNVRQTFQSLPIWGKKISIVRAPDGSIRGISGMAAYGLPTNFLDAKSLTAEEAVAKAIEAAKALPHASDLSEITNVEKEKVIFIYDSGESVIAYRVVFQAKAPSRPEGMVRPFVIIDAQRGTAAKIWNGVVNAANGTGPGGNEKSGKIVYGQKGWPALDISESGSLCSFENGHAVVIDMGGGVTENKPYTFRCPQSQGRQVNGAYSPLNDAAFAVQTTFEMYSSWLGAAPLKTLKLPVRVHFGEKMENAFWDGATITLGDGGRAFYPLTSLDVVSHEIAHGFTEQNSHLIYAGQSGAINEAFSDMAGTAAVTFAREKYGLKLTDPEFAIGRNVMKGKDASLRIMCSPEKDGKSISRASDYKPGMDVHYSSGVFNKAFCILSKSEGWSVRKAFEVFLRANENFWSADANFDTAADGVVQSANALGYDTAAIQKAFLQVGLHLPSASQPAATVNQTGAICSYLGDSIPQSIETNSADKGALDMIQKIVSASGLAQNFTVEAATVPNAAALIVGNKRKILYNATFLDDLNRRMQSNWAALSVLAHEIGHHLNGHTLQISGSQPQLELEADRFSGFILQRLGAPLNGAQAVISTLGQAGSTTHPSKSDRLEAIATGWRDACAKDADCPKDLDLAPPSGEVSGREPDLSADPAMPKEHKLTPKAIIMQ
ncbi:MAG: M4 family metallopeptidase [Hyphomicrobium sp.]|nr:M4 family metallopeptidase [Hyphomicrobium sp.]